jgi:hypothetical protein
VRDLEFFIEMARRWARVILYWASEYLDRARERLRRPHDPI